MKRLFLALSTFLSTAAFSTENATRYDEALLHDFLNTQKTLQSELIAYCADDINDLPKASWTQTAKLWFLVDGLQLPATEFMETAYQFVFWPDPKDRLRKQVNAAFASDLSSTNWDEVPAAAKSLSAIEFTFTTNEPKEHCDWMTRIMSHQLSLTEQLVNLQAFYSFDTAEQLTALHGTALSLHVHYKDMLGRPGKVVWQLGPAWRSDFVWPIQLAMTEQLRSLLENFAAQHDSVQPWLDRLNALELTESQPALSTLESLDTYLVELARYVEGTLAPVLEVFLGFNNFDGD